MPGDSVERLLKPEPYARSGEASRAEKDAMWPGLNDPYKAAGGPDSGEVSRLVVVMGKDGFKPGATAYYILQYVHLGLGEFGYAANGEQQFSYLFGDRQPKLLTVRGCELLRICDYIGLRRMPWIRLADRDFRPGDGVPSGEPIITRIEVTDWMRLAE